MKKLLAVAIIVLFVGASVVPSAGLVEISNNDWLEQDKLLASDGAAHDRFGWSVSIDGDYAIIGAYYDDDNGNWSGSAYVFTRSGSVWTEQAKLLASDGAAGDRFGWSVSIDGDYAIIGARGDDDNGDGSGFAYVFKRDGTTWTEEAKLLASDGAAGDQFGESVSIDGDYAIIGAYYDDDYGLGSGSAYIFTKESENQPPVADANGPYSGVVGEEMLFDASESYDSDGSVVGYRWDWENDGIWDTGWLPDSQISYVHDKEIHGTLKLEVKDDKDATDNDTVFIHVAEPFYFVHITDTHIGSLGARTNFDKCLKYIDSNEQQHDFVIITGDIVDIGDRQRFRRIFSIIWYQQFNKILEDYQIVRYCCPGNHDYYKTLGVSGNLDNYHKYVDNRDSYTFNYSNTQFFSLNSGKDVRFGVIEGTGLTDEQLKWLNETLDNLDGVIDYKDNSGLNKIIFMHHPVINYGGKIWKRWNVSVISQNRKEFTDLCDTYGVDLVLTGHTHNNVIYKRSDDGNNKDGQSAPIICTETLYVQTKDCKKNRVFREITIIGNEVTVEEAGTAP